MSETLDDGQVALALAVGRWWTWKEFFKIKNQPCPTSITLNVHKINKKQEVIFYAPRFLAFGRRWNRK